MIGSTVLRANEVGGNRELSIKIYSDRLYQVEEREDGRKAYKSNPVGKWDAIRYFKNVIHSISPKKGIYYRVVEGVWIEDYRTHLTRFDPKMGG